MKEFIKNNKGFLISLTLLLGLFIGDTITGEPILNYFLDEDSPMVRAIFVGIFIIALVIVSIYTLVGIRNMIREKQGKI